MYSKIVLCISEIEDEGNSIERKSKEKLEYSNDAEGGSEGSKAL